MPARIVKDNRAALLAKYEKTVEGLIVAAAAECLVDAVSAIKTGPKSGRTYRIATVTRKVKTGGKRAAQYAAMGLRGSDAGDGKTSFVVGSNIHRASAPGQAPATDTGNLAASIQIVRVSKLKVLVVVGAEYGRILELGGAKIKARPYLLPAFIRARRNLGRRVIVTFRKG